MNPLGKSYEGTKCGRGLPVFGVGELPSDIWAARGPASIPPTNICKPYSPKITKPVKTIISVIRSAIHPTSMNWELSRIQTLCVVGEGSRGSAEATGSNDQLLAFEKHTVGWSPAQKGKQTIVAGATVP